MHKKTVSQAFLVFVPCKQLVIIINMGVVQAIQNRYLALKRFISRNFEQYTVTSLCVFALLVDFRPSQSYQVDYTLQQNANITLDIFHTQILPIRTYSYIVFLLPSMLLTDTLKYKPGIVVGSAVLIMAYSCNLRSSTIGGYQFVELLFGFSTAMRIALLTYPYAAFPQAYYRKLTGYIRGYMLVGRLVAAVLAQILVSTNTVSLSTLNALSLVAVSMAFALSIAIPSAPSKNVILTQTGILPKDSAIPSASAGTDTLRRETELSSIVEECAYDENPFAAYNRESPSSAEGATKSVDSPTNSQNDREKSGGAENIPSEQASQSTFTDLEVLAEEDIHVQTMRNGAAVLELNAESLNAASENTNDVTENQNVWQYSTSYSCSACLKRNFHPIWLDIRGCYADIYVLKLSIWWIVSTCVYLQLVSYAPVLWRYLSDEDDDQLEEKGAIHATSYLLGCLAAFFCAFWQWQWKVFTDLMISAVALTTAALLIMTSQIQSLWLAYTAYIIFTSLYYMTITIASFEIASQLTTEKYALIFGNNFLLGAIMHCILMVAFVVISSSDAKTTFTLFLVNGLYLLVFGLGVCFLIARDIYRQGLATYIASIKQLRYDEIQNVHM